MEPRWLLSAWLSSCRTSASACSRCAPLSTCRLTSSSLRCPSSAATNRPSTVASSSATSVIWRAAAEFMVDDRGTSLKLNTNRCRDTKSRASFQAEYIIPRSLPRAPRRGPVIIQGAAPPSPSQRSATAEQEANGDSRQRGNADRLPRLITHVTIRRRERFLGLALRLFRTVRDRVLGGRDRAFDLGAQASQLGVCGVAYTPNQILDVRNQFAHLLIHRQARLAGRGTRSAADGLRAMGLAV